MNSDEPVSEVGTLSCNYGNVTSNYHNITFLRVPMAEAESDFEKPETEEDEEDEDDDETNVNHSKVKPNNLQQTQHCKVHSTGPTCQSYSLAGFQMTCFSVNKERNRFSDSY